MFGKENNLKFKNKISPSPLKFKTDKLVKENNQISQILDLQILNV